MPTQIRTETLNHMTADRAYPQNVERGAKAVADAGPVAKELSKNRGRGFAGDRQNDPKWYTFGNVVTGGILGYVAKTYSRNAYTGMNADEMREVGAKGIHWHSRNLGRAHLQAINELPKGVQNLNRYMAADYNLGYWLVNLVTLGHAHRVNARRAKDAQCDMPMFLGDVNETRPQRGPSAEERAGLDYVRLAALEREDALSRRDVHEMIQDQKIASSRISKVRDELTNIESGAATGAQARRDGEDDRAYLNRISILDGSPELRSTYRESLATWGEGQLSDVDFLEWSMPKLDRINKDKDDPGLQPDQKAGFTTFELAAIKYNYASYDAGDHARTVNVMGVGSRGNRIQQALNRVDNQYMDRYEAAMEDLNGDDPAAQHAALATLQTMRDEAVKIPHNETMTVLRDVQKLQDHATTLNVQMFTRFKNTGVLQEAAVAAAGGDTGVAEAFRNRLDQAKQLFKDKIIEEFPATPEKAAEAMVDQVFQPCDALSHAARGTEEQSTPVLDHAISVAEKTIDGMIDAYDNRNPDGDWQNDADYVAQLGNEGFPDKIADHWAGLNIENVDKFEADVDEAKERFQDSLMSHFPGTTRKNAEVVANDVYKASDNLALGYKSKPSKSVPVLKRGNHLAAKVVEGQMIIQDAMRGHYRALREMGVPRETAQQATKDAFKYADTLHWRDKADPAKRDKAMAKSEKAAAKQLSRLNDLRERVSGPAIEALASHGHATGQARQFGDKLFRDRAAMLDRIPESNRDIDAMETRMNAGRADAINAFHKDELREVFPPLGLKTDGSEQRIPFPAAALNEMSRLANESMTENAMQIAAEPISEKLAIDVRGSNEISINGRKLPAELSDLRNAGGEAAVQNGVKDFLQQQGVAVDERTEDSPLDVMTDRELASVTRVACQEIGSDVQKLCSAIHYDDANMRPTDLTFTDGAGGSQSIAITPYYETRTDHPQVGQTIPGKFNVEFTNTSPCRMVVDTQSMKEDPRVGTFETDDTESRSTMNAKAVVDTNKPLGQQVEYTDVSVTYSVKPARPVPDIVMDLDEEDDQISLDPDSAQPQSQPDDLGIVEEDDADADIVTYRV